MILDSKVLGGLHEGAGVHSPVQDMQWQARYELVEGRAEVAEGMRRLKRATNALIDLLHTHGASERELSSARLELRAHIEHVRALTRRYHALSLQLQSDDRQRLEALRDALAAVKVGRCLAGATHLGCKG